MGATDEFEPTKQRNPWIYWDDMTNEQLSTIIISLGGLFLTVSVALAGLILSQSRALRRYMDQMESRFDSRMSRMESQIGDPRERMAHLEGLLEGLRAAITRRRAA